MDNSPLKNTDSTSAVMSCREEPRQKLEGWASPSSLSHFCSSLCTQFCPWVQEANEAVSFMLQLSDNIPNLRPCKGEGSQALCLPAAIHKGVTISRSCHCCLGNFKRSERAGRILGDCERKLAQDTPEAEYISVGEKWKISLSRARGTAKLPQTCTPAVLMH